MKVTCFNDDSLFVMTFEGLTDEQKSILIKKYGAQRIGDVEAKAEKKTFLEATSVPMKERKIASGALKGFTVVSALQEKGNYAFKLLSHMVNHTSEATDEELTYVKQMLNSYVASKFNAPDENFKAYVTNLDSAGCDEFIDAFESIITDQMWQRIGFARDEFTLQDINTKKKVVYCVCCYWGRIFRNNPENK